MPRQDVPYGGAICRLRERIAEIFDKLGEKLHTINGVPGDGDGNVKIVSGSSAVVITNDPTQNEISVALDNSQLPAAAVSSVNGQTGAVALDAGDIPTVGGDVQADLQDLANDISGNTAAINAEALARQGADSTLQTNINAVTASLPSAAAAAVAADPTVAYINTELNNKVDLSDVSTVETPDTIAKRNGSGRLVAADPASGATDKTLVTANWVSQTGNNAPNNLIHKTGNEKVLGQKEGLWLGLLFETLPAAVTPNKWLRYVAFNTRYTLSMTEIIGTTGNNGFCYARAITSGVGIFNRIFQIDNQPCNSGIKVACAINQNTNKMEIWIYTSPVAQNANGLRIYNRSLDQVNNQTAEYFNTEEDSLPASGYSTFIYILGSP